MSSQLIWYLFPAIHSALFKCASFIYARVLDVEAVLSTVTDEVIGFIQWLFRQITGPVAALWNH